VIVVRHSPLLLLFWADLLLLLLLRGNAAAAAERLVVLAVFKQFLFHSILYRCPVHSQHQQWKVSTVP